MKELKVVFDETLPFDQPEQKKLLAGSRDRLQNITSYRDTVALQSICSSRKIGTDFVIPIVIWNGSNDSCYDIRIVIRIEDAESQWISEKYVFTLPVERLKEIPPNEGYITLLRIPELFASQDYDVERLTLLSQIYYQNKGYEEVMYYYEE